MSAPKEEFILKVKNPFYLNFFFLKSLPLGFFTGLRLESLSEEWCTVSVSYKYINKNPFRSLYFGVLAMAAELSTGMMGLLHTYKSSPSISMLVFHMEADFTKKAVGKIIFKCSDGTLIKNAIERTLATGEGVTVLTTSVGINELGEQVAIFRITWTFKARAK
jgi:hypothetical protein